MSITQHVDDAEKGVFDKHEHPIVITLSGSTSSHSDESHDTHHSHDEKRLVKATIPAPAPPPPTKKPAPRQANIWIRGQLWFNTYRKFFTITLSLNIVGVILAATGKWQYPRQYGGACVLGNLLVAILMRNELFGRLLYLIVNTLFAKVLAFNHIIVLSDIHDSSGHRYGFGWAALPSCNTSVVYTQGVQYQPSPKVLIMRFERGMQQGLLARISRGSITEYHAFGIISYLIWIGSDQEKTFGPTISGLIHNNLGPERVTLWDSKQRGVH
ncbi:hypothetical protein C0992_009573 [Termitomyces sp. T32_za158]|nr:hypothetical protein C0992_009573 [Termitomyces sp. T32_za158]